MIVRLYQSYFLIYIKFQTHYWAGAGDGPPVIKLETRGPPTGPNILLWTQYSRRRQYSSDRNTSLAISDDISGYDGTLSAGYYSRYQCDGQHW